MKTLFVNFLITAAFTSACWGQHLVTRADTDSALTAFYNLVEVEPSSAMLFAKKTQIQALRQNDSILFGQALLIEGRAHFYQRQIPLAFASFNQAVFIFQRYNRPQGILSAYYNLALVEASTGSTYGALVKLKKCLMLAKKQDFQAWGPIVLFQIAVINFDQREFALAWERLERALEYIPDGEQARLKSNILSLKGLILLEHNDTTQALRMLQDAKNAADISGDSMAYIMVYTGLAKAAMGNGNLNNALVLAQKTSAISKVKGGPRTYPQSLQLLSQVYLKKDEKALALESAKKAYLWAAEIDHMPLMLRDAAKNMAVMLLATGDTAKAYTYSAMAREIEESALTDEVNKYVLLPNQGSTDTTEDVESNLTSKRPANLLANEEVSIWVIGGLLFICSLLTILLIRRKQGPKTMQANKDRMDSGAPYPNRGELQKSTGVVEDGPHRKPEESVHLEYEQKLEELERKVAEQQRIAEEKQLELNDHKQRFEDLNKTKNKVFSVLTHDLRQPINQIKSVLNLLEMEELDGADRKEIVEKLKESVDNSSNALENLLLWSKKQLTGINTRIVDIHLLPQVWQLESHLKPNMEAKELKLDIKIPDFFKVKADMNQLDICLRNLVTNAIKFSNRGDTITIDAIEENGQKIVRVIDQGVGMSPEELEKLRNPKGNFSTVGTMNEKGTGLGIMITREFMENQNGRLEIMSRKGEGSIFSLIFTAGSASRSAEQTELREL